MRTTLSRGFAAGLLGVFLGGVPVHGVETEMLYSFQVLGGQYFFRGEKGALSGNVSGWAAPVMTVNDRWIFLPSLSSRYQGTKTVVDLVGAGSLFQEQMDHRAAVKGVYRRPGSRWSILPSASYKMQFLKETVDEEWFGGLFDYRMIDIGLEAEFEYKEPHSIRFGIDYILTHFPNYTSLESQIALDFQGQPLARELVGDNVLDSRTLMLSASISKALTDNLAADSALRFSYQTFGNQPIVAGTGLLTADTRTDFITTYSAGLTAVREFGVNVRVEPRLTFAVLNSVSNQNNYDASRTVYQPGYYNFFEFQTSPQVRVFLGDARMPVGLSMGADLKFRRYPHRKVQDAEGTFQSETLSQNSWTFSTSAAYPMSPRMSLLFNFQYGRASSNQGFEQFYSYNYTATNYLIGFKYEY